MHARKHVTNHACLCESCPPTNRHVKTRLATALVQLASRTMPDKCSAAPAPAAETPVVALLCVSLNAVCLTQRRSICSPALSQLKHPLNIQAGTQERPEPDIQPAQSQLCLLLRPSLLSLFALPAVPQTLSTACRSRQASRAVPVADRACRLLAQPRVNAALQHSSAHTHASSTPAMSSHQQPTKQSRRKMHSAAPVTAASD